MKSAASNATPSIIAASMNLKGDIIADGEIHLDGTVVGNIECASLTMGETSKVEGSIKADSCVIRGHVIGEIQASSVKLEKSAQLEGDVYHDSLAVDAGARVTGRFVHGQGSASRLATSVTDEATPDFLKSQVKAVT